MIGDEEESETSIHIPVTVLIPLLAVALVGCASDNVTRDNDVRMQAVNQTSVTGQRSSVGRLSAREAGSTTVIHAGDQIKISVWGYPEFNTDAGVKEEGTIIVPLVGEIQAAGLTKEEFTAKLKLQLAEYVKEDARVTVSLASVAGSRVHVMGAVTRQENYPVVGEVSLVEIITSAGGAMPEADLTHVKIYRNGIGKNAIDVDLSKHMERGDIDAVPRVRPGDTVFVPRQENLMRGVSDFVRDALVMLGFFRILN